MQYYVCGFMFSPDRKKVLLINKTKPVWQAGKINGIGGKIENQETPINAMVREFFEETGKETIITNWEFVFSLSSYSNKYKVFFFRSFLGFENTFDKTEETLTIENVKSLPSNVLNNLNWIVPMLLDEDVSHGIDIVNNNDSEWLDIFRNE